MTGLDPARDTIIEIATLITNPDLDLVAEGPVLAIHQPLERLEAMDEWNRDHHGTSGLWQRVLDSTNDLATAEKVSLDFIRQHVGKQTSPLCGNSVWQDRRFLARHMPTLEAYLHYRLIDVSTVKELARRWYSEDVVPAKRNVHRALDDIRESIEELRHYRKTLFHDTAPPAGNTAAP